jgi:hypothetical protein
LWAADFERRPASGRTGRRAALAFGKEVGPKDSPVAALIDHPGG